MLLSADFLIRATYAIFAPFIILLTIIIGGIVFFTVTVSNHKDKRMEAERKYQAQIAEYQRQRELAHKEHMAEVQEQYNYMMNLKENNPEEYEKELAAIRTKAEEIEERNRMLFGTPGTDDIWDDEEEEEEEETDCAYTPYGTEKKLFPYEKEDEDELEAERRIEEFAEAVETLVDMIL